MVRAHNNKEYSVIPLLLVLGLLVGLSAYLFIGLQETNRIYTAIQTLQDKSEYSGVVQTQLSENTEIVIPTWSLFQDGEIWSLVSATEPLDDDYQPQELSDLTLAHGDMDQSMQVQKKLLKHLTALYDEAEDAGHALMISSAYRSVDDQRSLQSSFVTQYGQAETDRLVANPGESEHHTGLAVDFSTYSDDCAEDSNTCSLGVDTATWLAANAHRHGFVLRYPEGKQSTTGVGYEPWHYRFVGLPLAAAVFESGLTLDEVLTKMYPAFSRS